MTNKKAPTTPPSPCVERCKIVKRTGVCRGCGRNLEEIKRWPLASEAERIALLKTLPERQPLMVDDED